MSSVKLSWLDRENPDERDLAGVVSVIEAARSVDWPHRPPSTVSSFAALIRHGWDGAPAEIALAQDEHGRVTGVLEVWLPHWDNTHLAILAVTVDPVVRRDGAGRLLFQAGVERARDRGRSVVIAPSADQPASEAFALAMGLDRASEEVHRRQDVLAVDWRRLDDEFGSAQRYSVGYELIRVAGAIPDDLIDDVVHLTAAINDAPTDELSIDDEIFTPERIRAVETAHAARNIRLYRLIARETASGALAGHTIVSIARDQPWHGNQYDTSVLREHRGHRLGLFLKIAMLRWLAETEPQLRTLDTSNSASNTHMIAVNDILGYQVTGATIIWQRQLDTRA